MSDPLNGKRWDVLTGDCLDLMASLPDGCVQCCVTSPPYFGLRRYGDSTQEMGAEPTPAEFVAALVAVFREVRRVLRDDGTAWLNIGDSYASTTKGGNGGGAKSGLRMGRDGSVRRSEESAQRWVARTEFPPVKVDCVVAPKNLMMMPARVAIALQEDGWYLRDEIIWHKPNPMPESVTDRCTKAHEKVYMLAKSERYFFDAEAIAEPALQTLGDPKNVCQHKQEAINQNTTGTLGTNSGRQTRNRRNVWTIASSPCKESHYAIMPPELARLCIAAGSPVNGLVLDPFCGAGTTGKVAGREGRKFIGCELYEKNADISRRRIADAYAQGKLDFGGAE